MNKNPFIPDARQRAIRSLKGIAVADAVGNELEFKRHVDNFDVLRRLDNRALFPTDDTQMTLFVYESLLKGWGTNEAALAWFQTQTANPPAKPRGDLLDFKSLYAVEAPGVTCMASCYSLFSGVPVKNNSKGNGTVMRASPFAVMSFLRGTSRDEAIRLAAQDARVTHLHPLAEQCSMLLVGLYFALLDDLDPLQAWAQARLLPGCEDAAQIIDDLILPPHYERLRDGPDRAGWVAEEALALALGALLHSPLPVYRSVIATACLGYDVDSDTVAGIAGGLAVAAGMDVPDDLVSRLSCRDAIEYITVQLHTIGANHVRQSPEVQRSGQESLGLSQENVQAVLGSRA